MRTAGRAAAAVLAASVLAAIAQAQPYPAQPLRWIVPSAPGTRTDALARTLARQLAKEWGIDVVADNRPGRAGVLGVAATASAVPDGYTIVFGQALNVAVAPALDAALPYDPLRQLQPVTQVAATPSVILAHPSLPPKSISSLIAFARAKPGVVLYGSPGHGTIAHLSFELFRSMARVNIVHVPDPDGSFSLKGLLGGEIELYASRLPPALAYLNAGRLRGLAVTSARRFPSLPEVPTVAEGGLAGYEAVDWYGVFAPAGTAGDIVRRLQAALTRVLATAPVKESFAADGSEIVVSTPDEFAAYVRGEIAKWARAANEAGIVGR